MELNPNHPTTRMVSDHWHKLAAILMVKLDVDHVVITSGDIARMDPGTAIVLQELPDGLHLRIIDMTTAVSMARNEGGLPS